MGGRIMHRLIVIAMTLLLSGFAGGQAAAQETLGAVSRIQGEASGTRGGAKRTLSLSASVFLNEVVSTGEAARLEVTFTDNTRLTLGEKAQLTLDRYVFNPAAGSGTIKFGVVGAFRFLSGQVSKLASSDVSVTTAVATLGIRGTEFWGGADRRSGARRVPYRRRRKRVERGGRADPEPARPRHQHRHTGRSTRARHLLAARQGQPRHRDRDVPIAVRFALD